MVWQLEYYKNLQYRRLLDQFITEKAMDTVVVVIMTTNS